QVRAQRGGPLLVEAAHLLRRGRAVVADAQVDVEGVGPVAQVEQHLPEDQAVLAAGNSHQDAVVGAEHAELLDGPPDLPLEELDEVLAAEGGVVAAQVDDGLAPALDAPHRPDPPEMAGRISTSTSPSTTSSGVSRVSPQMTMTVSGLMFSSSRMLRTLRRPSKRHSLGCGMRMKIRTWITPCVIVPQRVRRCRPARSRIAAAGVRQAWGRPAAGLRQAHGGIVAGPLWNRGGGAAAPHRHPRTTEKPPRFAGIA